MRNRSGENSAHRSGFIGVIGPANAGKSTLVNALVGEKVSIVSHRPHTTRIRVMGVRDTENAQCVFIDTPGFVKQRGRRQRGKGVLDERMEGVIVDTLSGVDLVLLVVDGRAVASGGAYLKRVGAELAARSPRGADVIILNKIDLLGPHEVATAQRGVAAVFCVQPNRTTLSLDDRGEIVAVSARTGRGVHSLMERLIKRLPEGPKYFPQGMRSDLSEHQIISEIIREKVFQLLREEVPYSVAVVIDRVEERRELFEINAAIIVERESQKKIVVGGGGSMVREIGIRSRCDLERFFKTKVHLELFVRVERNWTESEHELEKFIFNP